jgi:hypothetical protein
MIVIRLRRIQNSAYRSTRFSFPTPPIGGASPHTYNVAVEKKVRIFSSFKEADEANARDDMAMSPEERVKLVIELRDLRHPDAAQQGLARVCRVVKRERS